MEQIPYISKADIIDFLTEKGFKNYWPIGETEKTFTLKKERIGKILIKTDKKDGSKYQAKRENEILEIFQGIERLPKKIDYFEGIKKRKSNYHWDYLPYVLLKEFIHGESYNYEQLSTEEEQKIINLIEYFHKEKFANLDIIERNFIINQKKELYFVDFGWATKESEKYTWETFDELKQKDFRNLEFMLKKSIKNKF